MEPFSLFTLFVIIIDRSLHSICHHYRSLSPPYLSSLSIALFSSLLFRTLAPLFVFSSRFAPLQTFSLSGHAQLKDVGRRRKTASSVSQEAALRKGFLFCFFSRNSQGTACRLGCRGDSGGGPEDVAAARAQVSQPSRSSVKQLPKNAQLGWPFMHRDRRFT